MSSLASTTTVTTSATTTADSTLAQTCMNHLPEEVVEFMKQEWTRPSCIWQVKCTSITRDQKFFAIDYKYTRERVAKSFALQLLEEEYGSQHAKLEVEMQQKAPRAFWHSTYDVTYNSDAGPMVEQTSDSLVELLLRVLQNPPSRSGGLWVYKRVCCCHTPRDESHPWDMDHKIEAWDQYRVSFHVEKVCVATDMEYTAEGCSSN